MSRAPGQFAPSWLPRQQRRRVERLRREAVPPERQTFCTLIQKTRETGQ
jgi:hypothetical protein